MCFGSKSNNSTPAPAPVARFDYNAVPDTSNDQQRKNAATASTTTKPAAFGSELGAPATALTGGSTTMPGGT